MEIECQGCYYTLCSFVCLTEDLSEILQFLWRHGCLRKSYSCEKCGKICAIGDKDLFFRCNRNFVDAPADTKNLVQQPVVPSHPEIQYNGNNMHLDLSGLHYSSLPDQRNYQDLHVVHRSNILVHPALRQSGPLPGDPLPPTHPSPVYQTLDRHYIIGPDSMMHCGERHAPLLQVTDLVVERDEKVLTIMERNPSILNSIEGDGIGNLPESELADLDVQTKSLKRSKSDSTSGNLGSKKRCNFKVSMKKGTFFEKSKLPIDTVCKFVVFWCCMKQATQEFLRNELSLATRTVVDWSTTCREICIHWAKTNSEKIGGAGVIVQVDEVKINIKTGETGIRYSYYGMEKDKEKGKIFIVPALTCDSWNLLKVIDEWVLPGSVIISNCWKAYDCLKLHEFVQQTVVQNKTFAHPPSNTGPATFEEDGDDPNRKRVEDLQMPKFGTRRSHHLGDLAEYMFKRRYSNHLERMHFFFKQVAMAYPLR